MFNGVSFRPSRDCGEGKRIPIVIPHSAIRYPQWMRVLPMVVGFKPTSDATTNYSDNLCRWDRRSKGHYEVWFLTLNHRASQLGFWFRYTVESPSGLDPRAALWAALFNRR